MLGLLETFGHAVTDAPLVAAPAALAWGALSVFLSPCHLSSIPLVVAYMNGAAESPGPRRAAALAGAFALGNLASIAVVGVATVLLGRMAGDVGRTGSYVLAAVFFLVGLHLVGLVPMPSWSTPAASRLQGIPGALLLGAVFGAALGPCTFAFMAPVLGLAFAAGAGGSWTGAALVALYGLGHALAIVAAGVSVQHVQRWVSSRAGGRATAALRVGAGLAVLAGGLYFLFTAA
ncbi:MAG: cytochrome c biogenesis protein CcdA [Anaeromyxobacter sp.]